MEWELINPDEIYGLLGDDVVLIPLRRGSKKPLNKGWQDLTIEESKSKAHQKRIQGQVNLGVVLGENSNGLCTVDIDSDDLIEPFLNDNPFMRKTLQTKGKRGANFWFRAKGQIPRVIPIKGFGELRGTGGQTVISGKHPDGPMYRIIHEAKPVRIDIRELEFPTGTLYPPPSSLNTSTTTSTPTSYITPEEEREITELLKINEEVESRLAEWKSNCSDQDLVVAYEEYFERYYEPDFSCRNRIMVDLVVNLHGKVCANLIRKIAEVFYESYNPMFKDSFETHMEEFESHFQNVTKTFLGSLTNTERTWYNSLKGREQDAFRICRDFAGYGSEEFPPPKFILSCHELGKRLEVNDAIAQRILRRFRRVKFMKMLRKGTRRARGQRGRATLWRWNLSLREPSPTPTIETA
jgi:hypothetical protein